MQTHGHTYFDLTPLGETRWWSYGIGLWFTIVGAIFWQTVMTSPIPEITKAINPEAAQAFLDASDAMVSDLDLNALAPLFGGLFLTALLTPFFWILNRAFKGKARHVFGWLTGLALLTNVYFASKLLPMMSGEDVNAAMTTMIGISPLSYMLMLLSFPAVLIVLYMVQKFIHHRSILSLHTSASHFRWKRAFQVVGITLGVYIVFAVIGQISGLSKLAFTFDSSRFFVFALVSLLFIPLQAATEEILVRGYMNQGLVSIFKNKWIAFTLSSLAFMSLHLANPEAASAATDSPAIFILTMSSYFLFGFLLSIMVDFEGGLEAAIGVHAANNVFAAVFVNYENSVLPTPSMFLAKMNANIDVPLGMIVLALVTYLVYRTRSNETNVRSDTASV